MASYENSSQRVESIASTLLDEFGGISIIAYDPDWDVRHLMAELGTLVLHGHGLGCAIAPAFDHLIIGCSRSEPEEVETFYNHHQKMVVTKTGTSKRRFPKISGLPKDFNLAMRELNEALIELEISNRMIWQKQVEESSLVDEQSVPVEDKDLVNSICVLLEAPDYLKPGSRSATSASEPSTTNAFGDEVMSGLKQFAKDKEVKIILLLHLRKTGYQKRRPCTDDIHGNAQFVTYAGTVVTMSQYFEGYLISLLRASDPAVEASELAVVGTLKGNRFEVSPEVLTVAQRSFSWASIILPGTHYSMQRLIECMCTHPSQLGKTYPALKQVVYRAAKRGELLRVGRNSYQLGDGGPPKLSPLSKALPPKQKKPKSQNHEES